MILQMPMWVQVLISAELCLVQRRFKRCCTFFVSFPGDFMLDTMVALVYLHSVMSTYHPHISLMSTTKGKHSYTHTHTPASNTCAHTHTHPGGPISSKCLKPAHLLENQSCSAPGPNNSWNHWKSDWFSCNLLVSCPANVPFDTEGKSSMLLKKLRNWAFGLYIKINGLCQAG